MLPLIVFLANDLDKLLDDPKLSGSTVSCTVADEAGETVYERNSGLRVVPASNQKLVSTSFALYTLGPDYRPKTRVWKLSDRVVVDAPGDPAMTHERLAKAALDLGLTGSTRPVYVHEAYRPLIGPSWEWDDLPNKYAAPVCAFTVDRGSVELWAEGEKLTVEPRMYWIEPVRGIKTGPRKVVYDPIRRTLTVNGELPKAKTRIETLAVDQPDATAAFYFGKGFRLTGEVPNRRQDLTLVGPRLGEILKECLVHSDNNLAENLFLMAGSQPSPGAPILPDPYKTADTALLKFLETVVGEAPGDFHPEDGSGMSRHDLVTTRGIVKLLQWAVKQPTKDVWLNALAKPGVGTLSTRLKGIQFSGKTGSLDMVASLSGYVHTVKGRTLTVSLILNQFLCAEREARAIADEFIKKLAADDGFGTDPAFPGKHEARPPVPGLGNSHRSWSDRPRVHSLDARERSNRRAESANAGFHQPQ